MLVDFKMVLQDLSGEEILLREGEDAEPQVLTLARVCERALLTGDQHLNGNEKLTRFMLARRIHDAAEPLRLTAEEIVLLKESVAKAWSVLIYGLTVELLEDV